MARAIPESYMVAILRIVEKRDVNALALVERIARTALGLDDQQHDHLCMCVTCLSRANTPKPEVRR